MSTAHRPPIPFSRHGISPQSTSMPRSPSPRPHRPSTVGRTPLERELPRRSHTNPYKGSPDETQVQRQARQPSRAPAEHLGVARGSSSSSGAAPRNRVNDPLDGGGMLGLYQRQGQPTKPTPLRSERSAPASSPVFASASVSPLPLPPTGLRRPHSLVSYPGTSLEEDSMTTETAPHAHHTSGRPPGAHSLVLLSPPRHRETDEEEGFEVSLLSRSPAAPLSPLRQRQQGPAREMCRTAKQEPPHTAKSEPFTAKKQRPMEEDDTYIAEAVLRQVDAMVAAQEQRAEWQLASYRQSAEEAQRGWAAVRAALAELDEHVLHQHNTAEGLPEDIATFLLSRREECGGSMASSQGLTTGPGEERERAIATQTSLEAELLTCRAELRVYHEAVHTSQARGLASGDARVHDRVDAQLRQLLTESYEQSLDLQRALEAERAAHALTRLRHAQTVRCPPSSFMGGDGRAPRHGESQTPIHSHLQRPVLQGPRQMNVKQESPAADVSSFLGSQLDDTLGTAHRVLSSSSSSQRRRASSSFVDTSQAFRSPIGSRRPARHDRGPVMSHASWRTLPSRHELQLDERASHAAARSDSARGSPDTAYDPRPATSFLSVSEEDVWNMTRDVLTKYAGRGSS